MYTAQEVQQLHSVFRTMDTPTALQFVQQMRIPIEAIELFTFDHKKKTTSLRNTGTINHVIIRSIIHSTSKIRTIWNMFFVSATLGLAVSTLIQTLINYEEFEIYGVGQLIILTLKAQLLKEAFWDNWSAQHRPSTTIDVEDSGTNKPIQHVNINNIKSIVLQFFDTLKKRYDAYESSKRWSPFYISSVASVSNFYEKQKHRLGPGVVMLQAIMVLQLINQLIKIVFPKKKYAKYAQQLANPKCDKLEKYCGAYDGCLKNIDRNCHRIFDETNEKEIGKLRYKLLTMKGTRRTIELWHLVRADGTMRINFNEIAHAIATPNTWSKYISDLSFKLHKNVRGASHSVKRPSTKTRATLKKKTQSGKGKSKK